MPESFTNRTSPARTGGAIRPAIQMSPDEQANCYFMSNFVLLGNETSSEGHLDYLIPLMEQEPQSSCLRHAFNACSYSALGNRVASNSFNFRQQALSELTKAIRGVNSALKDVKLVKQDSTLAAITLLGFFEVCIPTIPITIQCDQQGLSDLHYLCSKYSQGRWALWLGVLT